MSDEKVIYGNPASVPLPKPDLRETDPKQGSYVYGREILGNLEELKTEDKRSLVYAINESLASGYVDVTDAYDAALAEGTVTCTREYLWTLGEGRWSLVDGDVKYYLQVFVGRFSDKPINHPKRILIRCWEFIDIEVYTGGDRFDSEPDIRLDGETGSMFVNGRRCNPTGLRMTSDGHLYLDHHGIDSGVILSEYFLPKNGHSEVDATLRSLTTALVRGLDEPEQDSDAANKKYVGETIKKALDAYEPKNGIQVSGAAPGQFLQVKEVDENGVPTAWETAELPTGSGGTWRKIIDFNIEEDSSSIEFENDMEGNPIKASTLFAMITLAVPTDEEWTKARKFSVSPFLSRDAVGSITMWFGGCFEITPVTTYSGTAPTHTGVLIEIIGENMATGQIWNSGNNGTLAQRLSLGTSACLMKAETLQYLKQPYANGFNMTSYQIAFPAGSRLQVWAIDYVGEE